MKTKQVIHKPSLPSTAMMAAAAALTVLVGAASAAPKDPASAAQIKVPAPVLGWASWNAFASSINFGVLKKQIVVCQRTP